MDTGLVSLVLLPVGLGLLGFLEPCSMGSNLVFIKYIEGRPATAKLMQVVVFALTRALLIGALGLGAALVGAVFLGFQKAIWIALGAVYVAIGAFYVAGKAGFLMRTLGPRLSRLSGARGSAGLGLLFGLNVPACAAPLLFVLLGTAAAGGAGAGSHLFEGFVSLGLFGLALSLPLVAAVLWAPVRSVLDRLAALSARVPFWAGVVLIALGLWSMGFGVFTDLENWA